VVAEASPVQEYLHSCRQKVVSDGADIFYNSSLAICLASVCLQNDGQ